MSGEIEQFVIYDHPSDFPEHFVVRRWTIKGPTDVVTSSVNAEPEVWLRPTLEEARGVIEANAPGLFCLPRFPQDDPVIVEVWV